MTRLPASAARGVGGAAGCEEHHAAPGAAADDLPCGPLLPHFTGPNALTLGYADPVAWPRS